MPTTIEGPDGETLELPFQSEFRPARNERGPTPKIGQMVQFVNQKDTVYAAVVVAIDPVLDRADLKVCGRDDPLWTPVKARRHCSLGVKPCWREIE